MNTALEHFTRRRDYTEPPVVRDTRTRLRGHQRRFVDDHWNLERSPGTILYI